MSKNKNSTDVYKEVDDYLKSVFGKSESETDKNESGSKKTKKSKKSGKSLSKAESVESPIIEEAIDTTSMSGIVTSSYYVARSSCSFATASSCVW